MSWTRLISLTLWLVVIASLQGCMQGDPRPVDIYPEDLCALCKMAVSDQRCASELLTGEGEVFKFDDIGCMEAYRSVRKDLREVSVFFMDYNTKEWVPANHAVVVKTGAFTPMGSGMVAFSDSAAARAFVLAHPVNHSAE